MSVPIDAYAQGDMHVSSYFRQRKRNVNAQLNASMHESVRGSRGSMRGGGGGFSEAEEETLKTIARAHMCACPTCAALKERLELAPLAAS